jgi:hypothetical protein
MSLARPHVSCLFSDNAPQLLLSTCRYSYNTFFTRLVVETKRKSICLRYQPLMKSSKQKEKRKGSSTDQ